MNLHNLDVELPPDWAVTVLHEFGHALGFEHEHQSPQGGCENELRWFNDPGYVHTTGDDDNFIPDERGRRPGLYTVLEGPPNLWSRQRTDRNLRNLEDSSAFETSVFDPKSIMKYYLDEWMFVKGRNSRCFGPQNTVLSAGDIAGAKAFFAPSGPPSVSLAEQLKALESDEAVALMDRNVRTKLVKMANQQLQ